MKLSYQQKQALRELIKQAERFAPPWKPGLVDRAIDGTLTIDDCRKLGEIAREIRWSVDILTRLAKVPELTD